MTKQPTDQQIIERLATEVMGWRKKKAEQCSCDEWHHGDGRYTYLYSIGGGCQRCAGTSDWNPLEDENDFRMVLEKIMENEKLWATFCGNVWCMGSGGLDVMHYSDETAAMSQYMKTGLRLRCVCLIIALDSLQDSPPQV